MNKNECLPLFDAICSVLGIYEPGDSNAKFMGLLSRVRRAVKRGDIDFSYSQNGERHIHVKKLKKWSRDYISDFALIEGDEIEKLDNLKTQNKNIMERIEIENTADLVSKAEKNVNETEAKKRAAEKTNKKKKEAKNYCIKTASVIWSKIYEDDSDVHKIGDMCELLMNEMKNHPEMFQPKSLETIRGWLKKAEKDGDLIIPYTAKKAGRPKK